MPTRVLPTSVLAEGTAVDPGTAAGLGRRRGEGAGVRAGYRCRDRVDSRLERTCAGRLGIARADKLRHRIEKVFSGIDHRDFALQLLKLRLQLGVVFPGAGELLPDRIDLPLKRLALRVQLTLMLRKRLRG